MKKSHLYGLVAFWVLSAIGVMAGGIAPSQEEVAAAGASEWRNNGETIALSGGVVTLTGVVTGLTSDIFHNISFPVSDIQEVLIDQISGCEVVTVHTGQSYNDYQSRSNGFKSVFSGVLNSFLTFSTDKDINSFLASIVALSPDVQIDDRRPEEERFQRNQAAVVDPAALKAQAEIQAEQAAPGTIGAPADVVTLVSTKDENGNVTQQLVPAYPLKLASALSLVKAGNLDEARDALQAASLADPRQGEAKLLLCRTYAAQGRTDDLENELKSLVSNQRDVMDECFCCPEIRAYLQQQDFRDFMQNLVGQDGVIALEQSRPGAMQKASAAAQLITVKGGRNLSGRGPSGREVDVAVAYPKASYHDGVLEWETLTSAPITSDETKQASLAAVDESNFGPTDGTLVQSEFISGDRVAWFVNLGNDQIIFVDKDDANNFMAELKPAIHMFKQDQLNTVFGSSGASQPASAPAADTAPVQTYSVTGIDSTDSLTVREGPGSNFPKVGSIVYNATGIEKKGLETANGADTWVQVSWNNLQGYVNEKYLKAF